jgi:hypothetical protein
VRGVEGIQEWLLWVGESSAEPTSEGQRGTAETDLRGPHSEQKALWESAGCSGAEEARGWMWEEPCSEAYERAFDTGCREEEEI